MAPSRRQQALSILGVIQYRKRVPNTAENSSEAEIAVSVEPEAEAAKVSVANSIQDLRAVAEQLGSEATIPQTGLPENTHLKNAVENRDPEVQQDIASVTESLGESVRQFDLRFWRCGNLLAVESSQENQADDVELAAPEIRHRLVNNIFRAIFGANTNGATMYTHRWPNEIQDASGHADDSAARDWLTLFFKGQKAKNSDTKLWLMGHDVIELLLADQGSPEELEGMRLQDNKLDLEVYVTPSLRAMIGKPYQKATTWKLLRTLAD